MNKSQLYKIFWITVSWTIISVLQVLGNYANMIYLERDVSDLDIWLYLKGGLLTGLLAGVMGGSGVVFLWEKWLRTMNYGWSLLNVLWTYTIIWLMVLIPSQAFIISNQLDLPFGDPGLLQTIFSRLISLPALYGYTYWLMVVLATMVVLLVNDKYGPGVFGDFLLGRYFQAKREERIFMFLDLRSSTTIAEKLGEERYFNFLKDVYRFATPPILHRQGEIYQYVGDEIVVSWKTNIGIKDANCVQCFFEVQKALKDKHPYFMDHYNTQPEFKAGLHFGHVMAGEIGIVKRDIAYSGDVLNTAARIQSKCNELGVNILISKALIESINLNRTLVEATEVGDILLRGKEQKVVLYTI